VNIETAAQADRREGHKVVETRADLPMAVSLSSDGRAGRCRREADAIEIDCVGHRPAESRSHPI
jgi:hypothetical protein